MRRLAKITTGVTTIISTLSLSLPALAQGEPVEFCKGSAANLPGCGGGLTMGKVLPNVINILLFVAFIAALIFLIIGGIRWILSGGDKEGTAKAKDTVTSALIGLAVVLGAWVLVNIVSQFITGAPLSQFAIPNLPGK